MTTKRMKHLSASTALVALNGKGSCFYRATAMVLDVPDSMLCIGTFAGATEQESVMNPKAAKQDFIHAWVEKGGEVFAPTLLTQTNHNFGPFPLDD